MNRSTLLSIALLTLGSSLQLSASAVPDSAGYRDKGVVRQRGRIDVRLLVPSGASYGSGVEAVDEHEIFQDGERFRLDVTPRDNGYIYVICLSSRGDIQMLYPFAEDGDNYVERGASLPLPARGWFRFDQDPGIEHVYVFESTQRLFDLERAAADGNDLPPSLLRKYLNSASDSSLQPDEGGYGDAHWRAARVIVRRLDLDHISRY